MSKVLGEKLRQYRNLKGFTLREVEKETKISNGYLNQLEQGKVREPSPRILHELAKCYNVPYEHLLELVGYIVPKGQDSKKKATGIAFSLFEDLTPDEEEELLKYLEFIREKKRRKTKK